MPDDCSELALPLRELKLENPIPSSASRGSCKPGGWRRAIRRKAEILSSLDADALKNVHVAR
jgi:hypothetical protein